MNYTAYLEEVKALHRSTTYHSYCNALAKFPQGSKEEVLDYLANSKDSDATKKHSVGILVMALDWYEKPTKEIKKIRKGFRANIKMQHCPEENSMEIVWNNLDNHRDKLIFALMAYSGLRVGEVSALNIADIEADNRIILRDTKNHKDYVIPLIHPREISELHAYLRERKGNSPALLLNYRGERLSVRGIQKIITKEFNDNGLEAHCHSLRRFFANAQQKAGIPIEVIQQTMRHSNVQTTMRYLNITESATMQALRATWKES